MSERDRLELAIDYVIGSIDPTDAAAVRQAQEIRDAISRGDPAWTAAVADAEATMYAYAAAIEPIQPLATSRAQLMKRAQSMWHSEHPASTEPRIGTMSIKPDVSERKWLRAAQAFTAIAALVLIVILLNAWTVHRIGLTRAQAMKDANQDLMNRDAQIAILQQTQARDEKIAQVLRSDKLVMVALTKENSPMAGRLIFDVGSDQGVFLASNMSALPTGKTYELWIITADQKKIPAGTFTPDVTGNATLAVKKPAGGDFALAAVTDEPAGGVLQPTGSIQIAGKF